MMTHSIDRKVWNSLEVYAFSSSSAAHTFYCAPDGRPAGLTSSHACWLAGWSVNSLNARPSQRWDEFLEFGDPPR